MMIENDHCTCRAIDYLNDICHCGFREKGKRKIELTKEKKGFDFWSYFCPLSLAALTCFWIYPICSPLIYVITKIAFVTLKENVYNLR